MGKGSIMGSAFSGSVHIDITTPSLREWLQMAQEGRYKKRRRERDVRVGKDLKLYSEA